MNKGNTLIKILGILFLVIGLFSFFLVPVEFTSFYSFSEGGNHHYEGFGFGSLMFTFILLNIIAYSTLAVSCILLGIGNLTLKKWGFNLSLAFFKALIIIGLTIIISFLSSFDLINTLEPYQTLIILIFFLVFLIGLPFILIKFYQTPKNELLFKTSASNNYFEKQSPDNLTIILLNLFWILIFYLLLFLKGSFPFFGEFFFKREGTYFLSIAIFILFMLTYLFYQNKAYAKFGMIVYYVILFFAFTLTFIRYTTNDFFNLLNLPAYEWKKVVPAFGIPVGINLAFFFGVLIILQIYLIFRAKIHHIS